MPPTTVVPTLPMALVGSASFPSSPPTAPRSSPSREREPRPVPLSVERASTYSGPRSESPTRAREELRRMSSVLKILPPTPEEGYAPRALGRPVSGAAPTPLFLSTPVMPRVERTASALHSPPASFRCQSGTLPAHGFALPGSLAAPASAPLGARLLPGHGGSLMVPSGPPIAVFSGAPSSVSAPPGSASSVHFAPGRSPSSFSRPARPSSPLRSRQVTVVGPLLDSAARGPSMRAPVAVSSPSLSTRAVAPSKPRMRQIWPPASAPQAWERVAAPPPPARSSLSKQEQRDADGDDEVFSL